MAAPDRRPMIEGEDPKVLSEKQVQWSSKDTRMFRRRVKQIEQAHKGAPGDGALVRL
jgi:hypothetical protein